MPCIEGDRSICKTQRVEHELVQGFSNNSLPCKQTATFSPLLLVSAQLINIAVFFRMSLQQTTSKF